jgi:hypothetical protein
MHKLRIIQTAGAVNMLAAFTLIAGYFVWAGLFGRLSDYCLGFGRDPVWGEMPAWLQVAIIEGGVVFTWFFREGGEKRVRLAAIFFGAWGLLWTAVVPVLKHEVYGDTFVTVDNGLGWYAWSSHILYGLLGHYDA